MSVANLIREASKSGVWVGLDGDNMTLAAATKPSDELIAKLRGNKASIVSLLRQAALAVRPAGYSDTEWLAAAADAGRLGYPPEGRPQ
jgi:hypothetical protein